MHIDAEWRIIHFVQVKFIKLKLGLNLNIKGQLKQQKLMLKLHFMISCWIVKICVVFGLCAERTLIILKRQIAP